tara:strand:- start:280 stop:1992 length:1713 start_codon:yes stop_codon:yes gene_type:complete
MKRSVSVALCTIGSLGIIVLALKLNRSSSEFAVAAPKAEIASKTVRDAQTGNSDRNKNASSHNTASIAKSRGSKTAKPDQLEDEQLPEETLATYSTEEIQGLAKRIREERDPNVRKQMLDQLLKGLTMANAREMLGELKGVGTVRFFQTFGQVGGEEAMSSELHRGTHTMSAALEGWAAKEPSQALDWYDAFEKGQEVVHDKHRLTLGLLKGMAESDLPRALNLTNRLVGTGEVRGHQATEILTAMGRAISETSGVETAIEWAQGLPEGNQRAGALAGVARAKYQEDPAGAIAWAESIVNGQDTNIAVRSVANEIAKNNSPEEALKWLGGLEDGMGKANGHYEALWEWTAKDPVAAGEYLASMDEGRARDEAITAFAHRLAPKEPQLAADWTQSMTDPKFRNKSMYETMELWAIKDPEAAAGYLNEMENSELRDHAVNGFASRLARTDPQSAIGWADSLEDPASRLRGYRDVFDTWWDANPNEATQHLNQLPPSPERDGAINGVALDMVHKDPLAAMNLAGSVSDDALREKTLFEGGRIYFRHDRQAAEQWLVTSGLSPESQSALLNLVQ